MTTCPFFFFFFRQSDAYANTISNLRISAR